MSELIAYKVSNLLNGKGYIGITRRTLPERWSAHVTDATTGRTRGRLPTAIRKYGSSAFAVEHVASARTWGDLCELERVLIDQHDTFRTGYNATLGGEGIAGLMRSEDIRAKISASQKKRLQRNPAKLAALRERALALNEAQKGKRPSPEALLHRSEMRRLKQLIELSNWWDGHLREVSVQLDCLTRRDE